MSLSYVGDIRHIEVAFMDPSQVSPSNPLGLADPTGIEFDIVEPATPKQVFTYPTRIVKDAVGRYHVDWTITKEGTHTYMWRGSGAVQKSVPGSFVCVDTPEDP